ncbi:MAG TPA: putative quinol monooxygenase [Candidatus Acidoferrum sp.]|nr:putative quinol monooxygenase [Candidatus Acidoferrum sp.]
MPNRKTKKSSKKGSRRRKSQSVKVTKLPKGAVTLIVTLRAKEGQHLLLEAELRALVGPTRKEEGCLQYNLHAAADHPGSYLLHEVWASRDDHGAHTRTPHFLRWNARKDALIGSRESAFYHQIA